MAAFEFAYSVGGANTPPAVQYFPVAASQDLAIGDPVKLSGGQVVKGGDGFGRCLGVMAQASDNATAATQVAVYVARPDHVWRATASADATAAVLGTRTYDLNASLLVNVADTTGGCIFIRALGSSNTEVYVTFTATEF